MANARAFKDMTNSRAGV